MICVISGTSKEPGIVLTLGAVASRGSNDVCLSLLSRHSALSISAFYAFFFLFLSECRLHSHSCLRQRRGRAPSRAVFASLRSPALGGGGWQLLRGTVRASRQQMPAAPAVSDFCGNQSFPGRPLCQGMASLSILPWSLAMVR